MLVSKNIVKVMFIFCAFLSISSPCLSQKDGEVEKIPVYISQKCEEGVSSNICYHVKEEIRKSERFKVTRKEIFPSVGVNILAINLRNSSSSTFSVALTRRDTNSPTQIEKTVENAEDILSESEVKKAIKSAKEEVRKEYLNQYVGLCSAGSCKSSAVSIVSFIDDTIGEKYAFLIRMSVKSHRMRE